MIKFRASGEGGSQVIGFGLSRRNIERLMNGEPISTKMPAGAGPPLEVVIFFGETEQAMYDQMRQSGYIDSDTQLLVDPKLSAERPGWEP